MKLTSENLNVISLILTIIGFYFAYFQYFKVNKDKKSHLLKLLEGQLNCLGPWFGTDRGDGYGNDLTDEQKYENALPSKLIFLTGSSPLIDLTILESFNDVPEEIIGEINQLYYDIKRIETIESYKAKLVTSDLGLSFTVERIIKEYRFNNPNMPFHHFISSFNNKKTDEKMLIEKLVNLSKILHCNVIGNKNWGGASHWTRIKSWLDKTKKDELKPNFLFILASIISCYLILISLEKLLFFSLDSNQRIVISLIIGIILSASSKALNISYLKVLMKKTFSLFG